MTASVGIAHTTEGSDTTKRKRHIPNESVLQDAARLAEKRASAPEKKRAKILGAASTKGRGRGQKYTDWDVVQVVKDAKDQKIVQGRGDMIARHEKAKKTR